MMVVTYQCTPKYQLVIGKCQTRAKATFQCIVRCISKSQAMVMEPYRCITKFQLFIGKSQTMIKMTFWF